MERTGRTREQPAVRWVRPSPRAREKESPKFPDSESPYLDPTQVPLGEKPKAFREIPGQGIRQNSPVSSRERVPALRKAGRSGKGGPTVY